MKKLTLFIFICIFGSCQTQSNDKFNLGFEHIAVANKLADGWIKWGNYDLSMDTLSHSGRFSGKVSSNNSGTFGSFAYKIPANYKGEKIKLEGFMKISEVKDGFAGLLMRIDGDGNSLAFDNMQSQDIHGTKDWTKYSIELDYPKGAKNIYVAGILSGKGTAWFDDFTLSIDGKNIQSLREVKTKTFQADLDTEFDNGSKVVIPDLNNELTSDLVLVGRVWGFLKYYHPLIAQGELNWDYELFRFLTPYLNQTTDLNIEESLTLWIASLGEIEECKKCKETSPEAFLKPDLAWITSDIQNNELQLALTNIYENRNQNKHYYIGMTPHVGNPIFKNEKGYSKMNFPDEGFRLLTLYRYWNMIQYFFPYKHLIDKDWNIVLKEYLPLFTNAQTELEYELATLQLIAEIKDTHANLYGNTDKINDWKGNNYAATHLRFIENKLVVTDYYNEELKEQTGLEIGDIITKIDGQEIDSIVSEKTKYYPASNHPTRLRNMSADMLRSQKSSIDIEVIQNGQTITKSIPLFPKDSLNIFKWYKVKDEKCYKMLDNNIGYITLANIESDDIEKIKETFINTKGIIIDIRNYPSTFVPFKLGSFFLSKTKPFVKFTSGNLKNPGEFTFSDEIKIKKSKNPYKGKLIVLLNEFSQSQAEYTAMAFRAGDHTTIIGSTTAGADGNISRFSLPGGLSSIISGIGVYYPNNEETQRIGIVPDIYCEPTIEGIKNGKDELLDKAIEAILIP